VFMAVSCVGMLMRVAYAGVAFGGEPASPRKDGGAMFKAGGK